MQMLYVEYKRTYKPVAALWSILPVCGQAATCAAVDDYLYNAPCMEAIYSESL